MPRKGEVITDPARLEILAKAREKAQETRRKNAEIKKQAKALKQVELDKMKADNEVKLKKLTSKEADVEVPQSEPVESKPEPESKQEEEPVQEEPKTPKVKKTKVVVQEESESEEEVIVKRKPKKKKKKRIVYEEASSSSDEEVIVKKTRARRQKPVAPVEENVLSFF